LQDRRKWDPLFLTSLSNSRQGGDIQIELVNGEVARGTIQRLTITNGEVVFVSGAIHEPESGRFFFQKQFLPGVAGPFVGVIEFPGSQRAYRIEPTGEQGSPELVQRRLDQVICQRIPTPEDGGPALVLEGPPLPAEVANGPIPDYQNGIVSLESLPLASAVVYLDFQGGHTPSWGGVTYDRPDVSKAEITEMWLRVSEDYFPFNINVTTDLHVFQAAKPSRRQRVIITPTDTASPGSGGCSYIGSFNWEGDSPCWSFLVRGKAGAEACSHEAGHALGLGHRGLIGANPTAYYSGHGAGELGWAPIMGLSYWRNVSQWCKGEYLNADNKDDDLLIITTANNGVEYRLDDTGSMLSTARQLDIFSNFTASAKGVIERTGDIDAFKFTSGGGEVSLRVDPASVGPNLR
jgi:hypothetical protein